MSPECRTDGEPVLEVDGLSAGYGKMAIVQDLSFEVEAGDILLILGPNGCGKSTLLKSLVGEASLLGGRIRFYGQDTAGLSTRELVMMGLGYVPQINNIYENLSLKDNLELGAHTVSKSLLSQNMREVIEMFPLIGERLDQKAKTLSGGERQFLAIGRCLMSKPKLLMLDEPSASVAPSMVQRIFEKISQIRESGVTVILVEQDIRSGLGIARRLMVMASGREVFKSDNTRELTEAKIADLLLGASPQSPSS